MNENGLSDLYEKKDVKINLKVLKTLPCVGVVQYFRSLERIVGLTSDGSICVWHGETFSTIQNIPGDQFLDVRRMSNTSFVTCDRKQRVTLYLYDKNEGKFIEARNWNMIRIISPLRKVEKGGRRLCRLDENQFLLVDHRNGDLVKFSNILDEVIVRKLVIGNPVVLSKKNRKCVYLAVGEGKRPSSIILFNYETKTKMGDINCPQEHRFQIVTSFVDNQLGGEEVLVCISQGKYIVFYYTERNIFRSVSELGTKLKKKKGSIYRFNVEAEYEEIQDDITCIYCVRSRYFFIGDSGNTLHFYEYKDEMLFKKGQFDIGRFGRKTVSGFQHKLAPHSILDIETFLIPPPTEKESSSCTGYFLVTTDLVTLAISLDNLNLTLDMDEKKKREDGIDVTDRVQFLVEEMQFEPHLYKLLAVDCFLSSKFVLFKSLLFQ